VKEKLIKRSHRVHIRLNAEEYAALGELRTLTGSGITETIVEALGIAILYKLGKIRQQVIGGGDEQHDTI